MDDIRTGMTARLKRNTPSLARLQQKSRELTLHQLRIFWAVARSETLTKAAKQLGLAQPSLSQQLGKLEAIVGTLLFQRLSNEMRLTEAGTYLLPKVEQVLRDIQELEDGLSQFSGGQRQTLRLAGINSVLHVLLPTAVRTMQERFPDLDFDIQESAPADILELLYARRINVGLMAASSAVGAGFTAVPLLDDPYVLVTPKALVLDGVTDPERQLAPEHFALLNKSVQFMFGSKHADRVAQWYDRLLPEHRVVARCRSFETAVGLVGAGAGVCLAPALATLSEGGPSSDVNLYRVRVRPRSIVALVPSQYRRTETYTALFELLQQSAALHAAPDIRDTPPFLAEDVLEEL